MDDELGHVVERVEAATQRYRDAAAATSSCGCAARCSRCRAVRLVAHADLAVALDELEATEARVLALSQGELRGA